MNYYKSVAVGSIKKFIPQEKRDQDSISRSLIEKLAWDPNKSFHGHAPSPHRVTGTPSFSQMIQLCGTHSQSL